MKRQPAVTFHERFVTIFSYRCVKRECSYTNQSLVTKAPTSTDACKTSGIVVIFAALSRIDCSLVFFTQMIESYPRPEFFIDAVVEFFALLFVSMERFNEQLHFFCYPYWYSINQVLNNREGYIRRTLIKLCGEAHTTYYLRN